MRGLARRIDRDLMRRVQAGRSPGLDRRVRALTRAANFSALWLCIAGVLAAGGGRGARRAAARGVVAIGIAAALANGPAKALARRRRPPRLPGPALIPTPRSTSFPSGHSASAFAFAAAASAEQPVLAPLLLPLAGAVAYSRVHVGVHYPSDVLAGAALGIASGVLAGRVATTLGVYGWRSA